MAEKGKPDLAVGAASFRPTLAGRRHAVSCGHYLATLAAMRVLDRGGNAIDAGVTAAMALAVLQPDIVSFAGVAPTLIYLAEEERVVSLAGLGYWPAATDTEALRRAGDGEHVPEGLLRTVMPAAPATHIEALRRWGTLSFEEAVTPALELAREGFAMYPFLADNLAAAAPLYRRWQSSAAVFLPGGHAPQVGELFRQADLGRTLSGMLEAERATKGDRDRKLRAAHDFFYRGPVADAIAGYHRANGGFVAKSDLAGFTVPVEDSLKVQYRGYEVHTNDVWCQGIVLLQTLKTLEGYDLSGLGHNTPDYLHLIAEALNLSFADREAYVGDPRFVKVPTAALLAEDYAARQRTRIDREHAFGKMPAPGNPEAAAQSAGGGGERAQTAGHGPSGMSPDTIYSCAMDRDGNAYSATLSDSTYDTPVIPGTGLAVSGRGCQSRLTPGHPSAVAPGKRPRLTPMPALVLKSGKPFMTLGTPGGDVQPQAMLQVLLNVTEFGMRLQQAIEAPRVCSRNFPDSFAPHDYLRGRLNAEANLPEGVAEELRRRGHAVEIWPQFPAAGGAVCAIVREPRSGLLQAGADPRREAYALAW